MANTAIPLTNLRSGYTVVTQVIPSSTAQTTPNSSQTQSPLQKFLKGEPKVLGAVQIMIGVLFFLVGIVMTDYRPTLFVSSGIKFWGSCLYIIGGSLAVSASNKFNICLMRGAMVVNILSAITAGLSVILLSLNLSIRHCYGCNYQYMIQSQGVIWVLLVFNLLQLAISISVSAFTCKATCSDQPTLNIINVVPNPEGYLPVNTSFPPQPGTSTTHTAAMGNQPEVNPPAYSETMDEKH